MLEEALTSNKAALEQEMPQLIANLAGTCGWKVVSSTYLPKGLIYIGQGDPMPSIFNSKPIASE